MTSKSKEYDRLHAHTCIQAHTHNSYYSLHAHTHTHTHTHACMHTRPYSLHARMHTHTHTHNCSMSSTKFKRKTTVGSTVIWFDINQTIYKTTAIYRYLDSRLVEVQFIQLLLVLADLTLKLVDTTRLKQSLIIN